MSKIIMNKSLKQQFLKYTVEFSRKYQLGIVVSQQTEFRNIQEDIKNV